MRKAAPTAAAIWTTTAVVRPGRRSEVRVAIRPAGVPQPMRADNRWSRVAPNGAPSRSRSAAASGTVATRCAARADTSRAPMRTATADPARTGTSSAKPGVIPTNSWSTMRAIRLLIATPKGRPSTSAATPIPTAMRRRRRRSGRCRPPSARMTAISRVRSVIRVFVVDASSTSATSPAKIPSRPMSWLTCRMSASIGVVPSGKEVGNPVNVSPSAASITSTSAMTASSAVSLSSTAVMVRRSVPPDVVSGTTASRSPYSTLLSAHHRVDPMPTTSNVVPAMSTASPISATPGWAMTSVAVCAARPSATSIRSIVRLGSSPTRRMRSPCHVAGTDAWASAATTLSSRSISSSWCCSIGVVSTTMSPRPSRSTAAVSADEATLGTASTPMAPTASASANTLARIRPGARRNWRRNPLMTRSPPASTRRLVVQVRAATDSTVPSSIDTTLSAAAARATSWVMNTTVVPCRAASISRSNTRCPLA